MPVVEASGTDVSVGDVPVEGASVDDVPVEDASVGDVNVGDVPVEDVPVEGASVGDVNVGDVPATDVPGVRQVEREPGAEERGAEPVEAVGVPEDAGPDVAGESAAASAPGGGGRRATALALIDDDELRGALEAILLVVDEPVTEIVLAQVLEQPTERIAAMLDRLSAGYTTAGHGFELRRAAGGWRLYTRPEYAAYVERFVLDGQSVRLTQAALETLAVVAYKQPVTRSRISAIRGVNCDGVIRTLVTRGLVQECGTEPESGAFLYRTTTLFLEKLGLDTVGQLPPLAPFLPDDVEEIADAPR
ncbi:SMC-Scp complex subunit ScpB [Plantactinospora mayteni]|nr:SMC-Scp complex subunit ScpB [Plantactinospora mayteni]